jgi:uncharacterized RDD family membrane protein YckC
VSPGGVVDPTLHQPLAPWWKRFVATVVDAMILGITYAVIVAGIAAAVQSGPASSTINQPESGGTVVLGLLSLWILGSLPVALYFGIMNSARRGQTLGKMALGIAVRDSRTGQTLRFWRAFSRYLITIVFTVCLIIPFLLDSLAPLWNGRKQTWHDRVVGSVVIDLRP